MSSCRDTVVIVKLIFNTQAWHDFTAKYCVDKTRANRKKYRTIYFERQSSFCQLEVSHKQKFIKSKILNFFLEKLERFLPKGVSLENFPCTTVADLGGSARGQL